MPDYRFYGRIYPERLGFTLPEPEEIEGRGGPSAPTGGVEADFRATIRIARSQLLIDLYASREFPVELLKNTVQNLVEGVVDAHAAVLAVEFVAEITGATWESSEGPAGLIFSLGNDEVRERSPFLTDPHVLVDLCKRHIELREALAELRRALTLPGQSAHHSFRAIEACRQHFLPDGVEDADQARSESWQQLRKALRVDRSYFSAIEGLATRQRHGAAFDLAGPEAAEADIGSRRLVDRFALYLDEDDRLMELPELTGSKPPATRR